MRKLILYILFILLFVPYLSFAGTYYIDENGEETTWADCEHNAGTPGPKSGAAACAYTLANTSAVAGDVVYYRGGTYSGITSAVISPTNTGTSSSNRITFSGYEDEVVTFVGGSSGGSAINLGCETNGCSSPSDISRTNNWIYITKLNFEYFLNHMRIGRRNGTTGGNYPAHRNEVSYCSFKYQYHATTVNWMGSRVARGSTYNHIHHNTFSDYGYFNSNDNGAVFGVGIEESDTDLTHYNLIEGNHFAHGAHHVVDVNGYQNVWRNNYIRNDAWSDYNGTDYGNRVVASAGKWPYVGRNMMEGNRIAYGGECADAEWGGSFGYWVANYAIFRHNISYQNLLNGFYFRAAYTTNYNKLYNNTFWYNGYSPHTGPEKNPSWWEERLTHGIWVNEGSSVTSNVIKNNIFYDNKDNCGGSPGPIVESDCSVPDTQIISNNWTSGDPVFVDISGTPDADLIETQFDFNLQSSSGAIDNGTYLTSVASVTDSDTIVVDDASYFFDGWSMAAEIPTATIEADWICLTASPTTVTYDNCVQISSINYSTDTIDTVNAHGASNGWYVWLYKDSEGTIVLVGSAPDQGAYEYGSTSPSMSGITIGLMVEDGL